MTCSFQADHVDLTQDDGTLRQKDRSESPSRTLALQEEDKGSVFLMDRPRWLEGDSRQLCNPMMMASTSIPGTYSLADLELMHHYVTKTFFLLADYEAYRPVWEMIVPREAQANEFLMRYILAYLRCILAISVRKLATAVLTGGRRSCRIMKRRRGITTLLCLGSTRQSNT